MNPGITQKPFGIVEGTDIIEYTITNAKEMQVSIINYGATITKIITPDKNNIAGNTILGYNSIEGYLANPSAYFGAISGRYCNRIANAKFSLDGNEYNLAANNNGHSLHGGIKGFDKILWNVEQHDEQSLKFTYLSKDGEEGFPGNLTTEIIYTLTAENELIIDYSATTDKATPVNLTSHCYFNLSAGKNENILDHKLKIHADEFTAINNELIPTGVISTVKNTALDFSVSKKVGDDISDMQAGYDHNFVLNKTGNKAAELYDQDSGRFMEMFTTEPALQFYSGGNLSAALCLEAQHYPNSPNEPSFPNTILRPGETYSQTTTYKFSVR